MWLGTGLNSSLQAVYTAVAGTMPVDPLVIHEGENSAGGCTDITGQKQNVYAKQCAKQR